MTDFSTTENRMDDADSRVRQSCDKPELPRELADYLIPHIVFMSLTAVVAGATAVWLLTSLELMGFIAAIAAVDALLFVRSWTGERQRIRKRRDRLTALGKSLPVEKVLIVADQVRHLILLGTKRGFRICAEFRGTDGSDYMAYSDIYQRDPLPEIDFKGLRVLFDAEKPLQSLIDPTSVPPCHWILR